MLYSYKFGMIICSTPHGDLYWLYDMGGEHYGVTESGHYYRRNETYGYYFIEQIDLTFKADKMKKYQWKALKYSVTNNEPKTFYDAKPIKRDSSFGSVEIKKLDGVEVDFEKFMDYTLTPEVFEAFKLLAKSNSGHMTQKYRWTGRSKPTNVCNLSFNSVYGFYLNDNVYSERSLDFFIGDSIHYITTFSIKLDDKIVFEFLFNMKKLDKLTYEKFYEILEKELGGK